MPYLPYLALVGLGALAIWNLDRHDTALARTLFVGFAAVAIAFLAVRSTGRGTPFGDFDKAYYPAGRDIVSAPSRVYDCAHEDGLCFVNPPVVALLFAPVAWLPLGSAHVAVALGSIAAVALAIWLIVELCGARGTRRYAIIALVLLNGPLYYSVRLGNLTHVVLVMVLIAVGWLLHEREGRAGALLAVTAVLKPPLLIWLPYFALRRRWRAAVGMVATLLAIGTLSFALFGVGLHVAWANQFVLGSSAHPIGAYNVQSIAGLLVRLTTSGTLVDWRPIKVGRVFYIVQIAMTAAVFIFALAAGAVAGEPRTRGARIREYSMVLCVMLLVSPVSWTHYYCLLLLPLAAYSAENAAVPSSRGWRLSMAGAALAVSLPVMLWVPPGLAGALVARVFLSHYVLGGGLLLSILAAASVWVREPAATAAPGGVGGAAEEDWRVLAAATPHAAAIGDAEPAYAGAPSRTPLVSVVVSTFNRCDSLGRTLDSLLAQDVPPGFEYEIIVVDNNSSDRTPAVLAEYREREPARVHHVFEPRQGVSHGRNAGIRIAKAPIVAFTDDDNEVDPQWIATIKATLDAWPDIDAVGGRILPRLLPSTLPSWLNRHHWGPLAILDYGSQSFATSSSNPRCLLTANLAVRREVFERIGGFCPAFQRCQDHELLIRLWRAGGRALYTPDLIVRATIMRERLTRRYHREWHARHGRYAALMQLQEIIDASGQLVAPPRGTIRLYGTPGFVYRELAGEVRRWLGALVRFDHTHSAHLHQVQYLVTYIRRMAATERRSLLQTVVEPFRFVHAHLCKWAAGVSMSMGRLAVAGAVIAGTAGGSIYDIATDREHWPFSPYAMFSNVEREPTLDALRLFGVTREQAREIPLLDGRLIQPFDQRRLTTAFERTYNNPARRGLTDSMLRDVLAHYERLRSAGEHDGPPLQAVRLYDVRWKLDPNAANVSTPDHRRLLGEVRTDDQRP